MDEKQVHSNNKQKIEKTEEDITLATLENRDSFTCFQRKDECHSSFEFTKLIIVGMGLFVAPLRFAFLMHTFFWYWLWLVVLNTGRQLGMWTQQTVEYLGRAVCRPGGRMILYMFGVLWIRRRYVTAEQMAKIQQQVRGTSETPKLDEKYKKKAPFIVISNHVAYFDPVGALAEHGECSIIARKQEENAFIIGTLTKQLKCLYTGSGGVAKQIIDRAKNYYDTEAEKTKLLLFPEATTSAGTHLLKFHDGAFIPGVPISCMMYRFPSGTSFSPAWTNLMDIRYLAQLFSQWYIPMEIVHFAPYYPTEAEQADAKLFGENVRKTMVLGANLVSSHLGEMQLAQVKYDRAEKK